MLNHERDLEENNLTKLKLENLALTPRRIVRLRAILFRNVITDETSSRLSKITNLDNSAQWTAPI